MNIGTIISKFEATLVQVKILHWQTKSFSRHKAFDGLYEELPDLIDEFAETAMGKYGRFTLEGEDKTINVRNLSEVSIIDFIQDFKGFLIGLTDELDQTKDTDLLNIRDEILGSINKFAYLLTLE